MKVGVVGTGYVGLVTGVSFADHNNEVTCVDVVPEKVEMMRQGTPPIYEEGLQTMMQRNIEEGRLHFTTDLREGVAGAAVVFLALPTPEGEDGSADLSYIEGAARDIGPLLTGYTVLVNKSTVPVGTAERVRQIVAENTDQEFDVVSNPEFLREGQAVRDVTKPERIVIGVPSERAEQVMRKLYTPYVRNGSPIRVMDPISAELVKYGANGFLATKISFNNELSRLADAVGADIKAVTQAMGDDSRIGKQFMHVGPGWGGSCFPKDSRALIKIGEDAGVDLRIMDAADQANDVQLGLMAEKIKAHYGEDLRGKKFAVWGLAFKKDTDDVRESPALRIVEDLLAAGAEITAYDPAAVESTKRYFDRKGGQPEGLTYAKTQNGALASADALVIATEWEVFSNFDWEKMKEKLKAPVIFDGRLLLDDIKSAEQNGFRYETIGRPVVDPNA